MTPDERESLQRLIAVAKRDTGQSRKVANLLLAWWNAEACGGFDLVDLWGLDADLRDDAVRVIGMVARVHRYPDALGFDEDFREISRLWR